MPVYSHTRLLAYEICHQQYKIRYVDSLEASFILIKLNSLAEEANKKCEAGEEERG